MSGHNVSREVSRTRQEGVGLSSFNVLSRVENEGEGSSGSSLGEEPNTRVVFRPNDKVLPSKELDNSSENNSTPDLSRGVGSAESDNSPENSSTSDEVRHLSQDYHPLLKSSKRSKKVDTNRSKLQKPRPIHEVSNRRFVYSLMHRLGLGNDSAGTYKKLPSEIGSNDGEREDVEFPRFWGVGEEKVGTI